MRSMITRSSTAALAGAFVLFAIAVAEVLLQREDPNNVSVPPHSMGLTSAIPGDPVSAAAQVAAFNHAVPILPETSFADQCSPQDQELLRPLAYWANSDQIGTTYSGGIWLAATPVSHYSPEIHKLGELPSVASFFGDDAPTRLVTGEVRGHTAWEADLSKDFSCASGEPVSAGPPVNDQTTYASPPAGDTIVASAVFYPPTEAADVMWVEDGYVVEVSGPLPVDELAGLAAHLSWQSEVATSR